MKGKKVCRRGEVLKIKEKSRVELAAASLLARTVAPACRGTFPCFADGSSDRQLPPVQVLPSGNRNFFGEQACLSLFPSPLRAVPTLLTRHRFYSAFLRLTSLQAWSANPRQGWGIRAAAARHSLALCDYSIADRAQKVKSFLFVKVDKCGNPRV